MRWIRRLDNFLGGIIYAVLALGLGMVLVFVFVEIAIFLGNLHYTP